MTYRVKERGQFVVLQNHVKLKDIIQLKTSGKVERKRAVKNLEFVQSYLNNRK